jgi:hypothetical protein
MLLPVSLPLFTGPDLPAALDALATASARDGQLLLRCRPAGPAAALHPLPHQQRRGTGTHVLLACLLADTHGTCQNSAAGTGGGGGPSTDSTIFDSALKIHRCVIIYIN